MYDIKALYEATSVDDACRLLKEHPGSQVIAGGSDVLVQIREGKRAGKELVKDPILIFSSASRQIPLSSSSI